MLAIGATEIYNEFIFIDALALYWSLAFLVENLKLTILMHICKFPFVRNLAGCNIVISQMLQYRVALVNLSC